MSECSYVTRYGLRIRIADSEMCIWQNGVVDADQMGYGQAKGVLAWIESPDAACRNNMRMPL